MIKTYQCIGNLGYIFQLPINETLMDIRFVGGRRYPNIEPGKFSTDDKDIQKALENNPNYDVTYNLVQVGEKVLAKGEPVISLDERLVKLETENKAYQKEVSELKAELKALTDAPEPDNGIKEVFDVVNAQQAKEYIVKHFGHDPQKLNKKMIIMNAAKKYKVTFPDWKP